MRTLTIKTLLFGSALMTACDSSREPDDGYEDEQTEDEEDRCPGNQIECYAFESGFCACNDDWTHYGDYCCCRECVRLSNGSCNPSYLGCCPESCGLNAWCDTGMMCVGGANGQCSCIEDGSSGGGGGGGGGTYCDNGTEACNYVCCERGQYNCCGHQGVECCGSGFPYTDGNSCWPSQQAYCDTICAGTDPNGTPCNCLPLTQCNLVR